MLIFTGCGGQRMMMGTGGTSGTYYAFGGVLAQYMTDYTDYRVTAVSTAASKANIQSIGDGDYQIGFTQSDVMNYAWDGSRSFETLPSPMIRSSRMPSGICTAKAKKL